MHLETGESDKGILELFGGHSSLLKKDMHMGGVTKILCAVEKARDKATETGSSVLGFFMCAYPVGMYVRMHLHGVEAQKSLQQNCKHFFFLLASVSFQNFFQ